MTDTPTLCFCNSNRVWGGGEQWHLQAARYFAESGYRVFMATGAKSDLGQATVKMLEERPELSRNLSCSNWCFGNMDFLNPAKIIRFGSWLGRNGVTHLIMGLPADLKAGVMAACGLKNGIKLFYRRGSALPVKPGWSNRFFYGALAGLIVNSQETERLVLQAELIDPAKVHVIYNSLDIEEFDRKLRSCGYAPAKRDTRLAAHPLVIGNAGRLNVQKGQKYLLEMSAALKSMGIKHQLIIAGSGELLGELKSKAATLGLDYGCDFENDVCFAGFIKDMSYFWRRLDLFVLSSLWEGFGYVLAEAMLAEKPVCAFDCNSMPELVKDGLNGCLMPPPAKGETDSAVGARMAMTVRKFIDNPAWLTQMGRNGRQLCENNFSRELTMRELAKLLFT